MLNRRTFAAAIAATALTGVARALKVDDDDAIRDILKRRVKVEKRTVGMAVCVVTPNRQRFVTYGRERLGDPVAHHLPSDFHLPEVDGRQITLADLATHTSGLPTWPPSGLPAQPPFDAAALSAFFQAVSRFSLEDFRTWLANVHAEPHPPTAAGWWYSNAGYALLGIALSFRGRQSFESLLQTRVIKPIGLHDTTFHPTAAMEPRLAEGHDAALNPIPPLDLGIFTAAGGLRSTPQDLSRFAAAILPGSGAPIAPDEQLLLSVRRPARWIGGTQALGWEVVDDPGGAFVSKDGVTFGLAASMVFDPDTRVAIMVVSNTFPDLRNSTLSGGGVGAADIARHLLRPPIPLSSN